MYKFIIFGFSAFIASVAPFCDGNNFITKGLYGIVLLVFIALNVNDIIEVLTKEDDDTPRKGIMDYLDYIEVGAGIASSLLLIRAAYTRECSFYYILIIILAPIVLVVSLIVVGFSAVFLGLTEFSSMDYLPSGVKKLNDIIDIIPRPKNENEIKRGPDGDISESKSFIKRSTSAADNVSTFSESITDNSKNIISDSRSVVSSAISPDSITELAEGKDFFSDDKKNM